MPSLKRRTTRAVGPGRFHPLGATLRPDGVNFALYSRHATEVFLALFNRADDAEPTDIIPLESRTRFVFHAFVHGLKAGQLYGYWVRGPFDPAAGQRFNEHKLLVDPHAKALSHKATNRDGLLLAYDAASPARDLSFDARNDAAIVPKGIVVDDAFDWRGDASPEIPFEDLVIYEAHLKGMTAHPSSKVDDPGTYLGFIEKIPHLVELGVNAVELLPLHERYVGDFLRDKGLTNYWGYDTLGFFAPESAYRASARPGDEVVEMKTLVRELHRAGIEVILDVVYNHSAEGNELGPTLSFRGIDNATYYALTGDAAEPKRRYENWSGCGNSLNLEEPHVTRFVLDSLRYWVEVMHVDGFRFDLASVLGRRSGRFQKAASFFDVVAQDPSLSRVKLIAEPWDLGAYEVGNFPVDWSEWNGRFRDAVRRFEKGDGGLARELAARITGSADLYGDDGRKAYNSVNFVTCHDGFTLRDLVSYSQKHNLANLEDNKDGTDDNASWSSGAEGETDDPQINALRRRRMKNLLCYLLFSAGTPMLLSGDEFGRTQKGNNNAYCQDNPTGWLDWDLKAKNADIFDFVRWTIGFSKAYPVLRRRTFFAGRDINQDGRPDLQWFGAGATVGPPDWDDPGLRTLAYQLDGAEADSRAESYLVFVILNADWAPKSVPLPPPITGQSWRRAADTSLPSGEDFSPPGEEPSVLRQGCYEAAPRSVVVLLSRA